MIKNPLFLSGVAGAIFGAVAVLGAQFTSYGLRFSAEKVALTSADISALAGALLGAIVGGGIAYVLQRTALNEQRAEREAADASERRALGHSIVFKMLSIVNNHAHLKKHVEECYARVAAAEKDIDTIPPVSYLVPILNVAPAVNFESNEMGMLLSLKDDETFNRVLERAPIHNSILVVWQSYLDMRSKFNAVTSNGSFDHQTGIGETAFAANSLEERLFFEVNDLAKQLIERANQDFDEANGVLRSVIKLLRKELDIRVDVAEPTVPASISPTTTPV